MAQISLQMKPRPPFRLDLTVWALRRQPHNLVDQWDGRVYKRVFVLENEPLLVEVVQNKPAELTASVSGRTLPPGEGTKRTLSRLLRSVLGTSEDLGEFYRIARRDPKLNLLANALIGLKPPRFPSVFEALINAFACQQISLNVGITLLNRLSEAYGPSIRSGSGLMHAFPGPENLVDAEIADLRTLGFSANKARAVLSLARSVLSRSLALEGLSKQDDEDAVRELLKVPGVGRWSAEYVLLRGLRRLAVFPGDDVGAQNNFQRFFSLRERPDYGTVRRMMRRWQPYSGFVYFHFLLMKLRSKGFLE